MSLPFSFNKHQDLRGKHALFSPSQSSWLRYDEDKIVNRVASQYRAPLGTEIHEYAAIQIMLGHKIRSTKNLVNEIENNIYQKYIKNDDSLETSTYGMTLINNVRFLPPEIFETVKAYVNDGIGYKMNVEQPLQYSEYIFGTADTISFRDNFLRIHDLKTGDHEADIEQLITYAALFCLEYKCKPSDIDMELRIYQAGECAVMTPQLDDIVPVMDRIVYTNNVAKGFINE